MQSHPNPPKPIFHQSIHPIDYSKFYHPNTAFAEWLAWIECMAMEDIEFFNKHPNL